MKKGAVAVLSVAATLAIVGAGVGTIAALKHNNVPMPWDAYVVPEDATFGIDKNEDGEFVRTGAAIGLKAGINGERNDFDHVGPWSKIKTVQIGDEIAVRIPKYYQNAKGTAISLVKQDSTWSVPAAFLDKNGNEKDHFDYGAYAINVDKDGAAHSQEGGAVTNGLSLNAYRAAAKKTFKSTSENKAHIASYAEYSSVIQLMAIEFGTPRFQDKLPGVRANISNTVDTTIQIKGKKNVIYLADKGQLAAGMPFEFVEGEYRGYWAINKMLAIGTIKSIHKENVEVEVETSATSAASTEASAEDSTETEIRKLWAVELEAEDDIDVGAIIATEKKNGYEGQFGFFSAAYENGFVNNHGKGSIRVTERLTDADNDSSAKFRQSFSYRGIENVYGNYYQWLDGITSLYDSETQEINVMTCLDPAKFENANNEAETANGYKTILTFGQSDIKSFLWEGTEVKDGFVVPTKAEHSYNASSTVPDYALGLGYVLLDAASGFRAFCTGAFMGDGGVANYGAFRLSGSNDSSSGNGYYAARLSFE